MLIGLFYSVVCSLVESEREYVSRYSHLDSRLNYILLRLRLKQTNATLIKTIGRLTNSE